MENNLTKIKNWVSTSFQLITVGLLIFAIVLILKQQSDINTLKSKLNSIENNIGDLSSEIQSVESNLSSEIDDVRRAVIVWSD